jgi:hypothetical protein
MNRKEIAWKAALNRFFRVIIPQLPTILNYLIGFRPEWTPWFVLLGSIITALDKFLREIKVIDYKLF